MKRATILIAVFLMLAQFSMAQQATVRGIVTSQEDGLPVIGATVLEKGTTNGTTTDLDGAYLLSVAVGSTLEFSYLGMQKQSLQVHSDGEINVVLQPDAIAISEVVVTAMGVKTEKKKLNFAVQSVSGDALTDSRSPNFVSALQGKVSGISVTNAGGSPNAGSNVIIRGISSINPSQSNQPLYVLDGIAVLGGTADINPNDIENITVLKGAAASALYGQDAAKGVIMITTKQGVAGKMTVNANASWQIDHAVRLPAQQTTYGPGVLGFYKPEEYGGTSTAWGPPLTTGTPIYDNIKNYFQQGLYQKYDVSMNGGTEKFQSYVSASFSAHDGIVPNDYLNKLSLLAKGSYKVSNNLTMSAMLNIVNNTYRGAGGVLSSVYSWPITDDITNYADQYGNPRFRYIRQGEEGMKRLSPVSPLFGRYMDQGVNNSTRNIFQASLVYEPVKKLQLTARFSRDANNYTYDGYTVPRFDILTQEVLPNFSYPAFVSTDPEGSAAYNQALIEYNQKMEASKKAYYDYYYSVTNLNEKDLADMRSKPDFNYRGQLGTYEYSNSKSELMTVTGMANYSLSLPKQFTLELMAGGEIKMRESSEFTASGREFLVPKIYALQQVAEVVAGSDVSLTHTQRRNVGVFGEVRLDYKGLANLSATYRADWSSAIRYKENPYTYPSVTGGLIFSELFGLSNEWFSFGKLRGNWAVVGKDAPPKQFDRIYKQYPTLPDGGYGVAPDYSVASDMLTPELSTSFEVGVDLRFFDNRTRLDAAYYSTSVNNQIVTVRVSPAAGFILQTRNEGWITNRGVEMTLEQDIIKNKNFSWTVALNFGLNRGTVEGLPEDVIEITGTQYGDIFPTAYLHGSTTALSGKDYERTADGQVIVDENGYPKINAKKDLIIGNREPDFLLGLSSKFDYRGISLSFLLDGRQGGDVVNVTERGMMSSGQDKAVETYRGRQVVWEGVVLQPDGSYKKNTTPIVMDYQTITNYYHAVSSNFIEDGSYIRLSYVTIGYDISRLLKRNSPFKSLKASLTGSNLFLLTRYTGSDPQINASTTDGGTGSMGIDDYAVPSTRSFNLTLSATF
jgi:TonB-linked SusC/RagA family outer membrane protein